LITSSRKQGKPWSPACGARTRVGDITVDSPSLPIHGVEFSALDLALHPVRIDRASCGILEMVFANEKTVHGFAAGDVVVKIALWEMKN
jgi:hypothetical protein